jgi:hypothetical protein
VTGSAPVPTVTVDQAGYRRGGTVRASVAVVDADNRVESLSTDGTAPDGTALHIDQRQVFSDRASATWRWAGTTAVLGTGLTLAVPVPARSGVLEAVVVDAQGHTVVASCPVVVQGLALGVDVQGSDTSLTQLDAAYLGWPAFTGPSKLFWSAGAGVPTWTGKTARVPATGIPHLAYIDPLTVDQIVGLLDTYPGTWREVWLTPHQEGDRTMAPDAFKASFAPLVAALAGHPLRLAGRVRVVVNLTEYWQRTKGGNAYAAYIPPGLDPALDYLGVDNYPGGQTGYTPPATVLAGPVAAAEAARLKLVFPEFGVVVPAYPTAAQLQARAVWYRDLLVQAEDAGVVAAGLWQADGKQAVGTGGFILGPDDPARAVVAPYLI